VLLGFFEGHNHYANLSKMHGGWLDFLFQEKKLQSPPPPIKKTPIHPFQGLICLNTDASYKYRLNKNGTIAKGRIKVERIGLVLLW
jgi:hypothetical protein